MRQRAAENPSVERIYIRWNVSYAGSDGEGEFHIPVSNLQTVESKYSTGVDMSNDGAVIQRDLVAQLDEIGFGHKHIMTASTYRAVLSNLRT